MLRNSQIERSFFFFWGKHNMNIQRLKLGMLAAASSVALLLSACGGGSDAGPRAQISRVVVAGDSLADAGTFGLHFTVQNAADPAAGYPIFPQLVAQDYGINAQCNFFVSANGTFAPNATAGCTNFAIGGGRIVTGAAQGGPGSVLAVPVQLATAVNAEGGAWTATDLILVDGGGNDAADLVKAYLGAASGPAGVTAYQTFLAQQLDAATIGATLQQPNGAALAAGLYMQKLADTYYDAIKTNALDKGATHVAVLNIPDITLTPNFAAVLAQVAQANGGGTAGATAAATLQGAIQQWVSAFNTELRTRIGSDARVAQVDFYADITDDVANPASYGLTNATQPACQATNVDPNDTFAACTDAALDAAPPAGAAAGWWKTWLFADGFHPTPFGHRLLAASVSRALARAGWL